MVHPHDDRNGPDGQERSVGKLLNEEASKVKLPSARTSVAVLVSAEARCRAEAAAAAAKRSRRRRAGARRTSTGAFSAARGGDDGMACGVTKPGWAITVANALVCFSKWVARN